MKKYIKIGLSLLILFAILIPPLVTADPPVSTRESITFTLTPAHSKVIGRWGVFGYDIGGGFNGFHLHGNRVIGIAKYNNEQAMVLLFLNPEDGTFTGTVSYKGDYDISGIYRLNNDRFVALWTVNIESGISLLPFVSINGWLVCRVL